MIKSYTKILILISSTFQLMNILEYIYQNDLDKKECVLILLSKRNIVNKQILNSIIIDDFLKVIILFSEDKYLIFKSEYQAKELLKSITFSQLLIGNIENIWCKYVLSRSKSSNIPVVVDDGALTIVQANKRGYDINNEEKILSKNYVFKLMFFSCIKQEYRCFKFFTIFNNLNFRDCDIVIENKLLFQRKKMVEPKTLVPEIWFIGTPLVQKEMISMINYNKILNSVVEFGLCQGLKVKYFKHRIEGNYNLPIEQVENNKPFELFYLESNVKPKYIISFFSTVLFSVSKFTSERNLFFIEIPIEYREKGNWGNTELVYDALKVDNSIEKFPLSK